MSFWPSQRQFARVHGAEIESSFCMEFQQQKLPDGANKVLIGNCHLCFFGTLILLRHQVLNLISDIHCGENSQCGNSIWIRQQRTVEYLNCRPGWLSRKTQTTHPRLTLDHEDSLSSPSPPRPYLWSVIRDNRLLKARTDFARHWLFGSQTRMLCMEWRHRFPIWTGFVFLKMVQAGLFYGASSLFPALRSLQLKYNPLRTLPNWNSITELRNFLPPSLLKVVVDVLYQIPLLGPQTVNCLSKVTHLP